MVTRMLIGDWERTREQLAGIAAAILLYGLRDLEQDLAAAQRSLEDKFNPLQAGIELIAIADDLVNIPELWNRTVALASELLCFPNVEKIARFRGRAVRTEASRYV